MPTDRTVDEILVDIKEKGEKRRRLLQELAQGAALQALGITRHHIVKKRRVTSYGSGKNHPTGKTEIIMQDGTKHVVPDALIWEEG